MSSGEITIEWDQLLDALALKDHDGSECERGEEYDIIINLHRDTGLRKILLRWMHDLRAQQAKNRMTTSKSASFALSSRELGNASFKDGDYEESLECYNISINVAPVTDETYSIALSNRSAVLLKMQKYRECLRDIDLSLASGYPEKHRHKIYLRQAECYFNLGLIDRAEVSCETATAYLYKSSQLSKKCIADIHKNIVITSKKLRESGVVCQEIIEFSLENLPKFDSENEALEGASPSLDLRYSEEFGRHVVTNKDVKRGDVLFVEKPFAFVNLPTPRHTTSYCENCLVYIPFPVPCSVCIYSKYCSEECRIDGWERYHQWECPGSTLTLWSKIGIAHLAFRVFLVASNDGFMLTLSKKLKPGNEYTAQQVFNCMNHEIKGVTNPRGYQKTFQLLTNFSKMDKKDFKRYALTSILLMNYLKDRTDFFESHIKKKLPFEMDQYEAEILAACLILRHLGQLVANGHAIVDVEHMKNAFQVQRRLGTAIYPSVSMLNHSCEPNIINSHFKDYLIVKATHDIPKGSEVFNCYGPHYRHDYGKKRRAQLEAQYFFKCKCTACTNPEKDNYYSLFHALLCQSCRGPIFTFSKGLCNNCGVIEKGVGKLKSLHKKSIKTMKSIGYGSDYGKALAQLRLVLEVQNKCLYKYHTDIRNTTSMMAFMHEKTNNFKRSIEVLEGNLFVIKYQFGDDSIEVAHELSKLADVYISQLNALPKSIPINGDLLFRTKKLISEAADLFATFYGPWTKLYTEMHEKLSNITSIITDHKNLLTC